MDAVEFIKERMRMCDKMGSCSKCPLYNELKYCDLGTENPNKLVSFVEQWSKEYPRKTMMQDFFEKFPNATKDSSGNPMVCPQALGYGDFCCDDTNHNCTMCWSRPMGD